LTAALQLDAGSWERSALVIAAIAWVPVFLAAMFVLQTKFRAELQEDSYYSEYLSKKSEAYFKLTPAKILTNELRAFEDRLASAQVKILPLTEQQRIAKSVTEINSPELNWDPWRVALNEFHPRFAEVRSALRDSNIPLSEIFGSDAPPKKWIIAIHNAMPLQHKMALLRIAMKFQFDGFQFWTPIPEADETEDVYIGSYGITPYVEIRPQLESLLTEGAEEADLHYYMRNNRIEAMEDGTN
jgi:hypothetical protein